MTDRQGHHRHSEPDHAVLAAIRELHAEVRCLRKELSDMSTTMVAALSAAEARVVDLKAAVVSIQDALKQIAAGGPDQPALVARVDAVTSGISDVITTLSALKPPLGPTTVLSIGQTDELIRLGIPAVSGATPTQAQIDALTALSGGVVFVPTGPFA